MPKFIIVLVTMFVIGCGTSASSLPSQNPVGTSGTTGTAAAGAGGTCGCTEGPAGPQGPVGPQGPRGATGATGLQGPKGDTGATGAQGAQGQTGAQGQKGDTGAQGMTGATGATGAQGPQGIQGPAGKDGKDGVVSPSMLYVVTSKSLTASSEADCDPGDVVISGGCSIGNGGAYMVQNQPGPANSGQWSNSPYNGSAWYCRATAPQGWSNQLTATAVCMKVQ